MSDPSHLLDDKLLITLFLFSLVAFVLLNFVLWLAEKPFCKSFFAFVMYFMALEYAFAFTVHLGCSVLSCNETILSFTEPKLDTKFLIFGGLAMWQYGFTGLINTVANRH